MEYPMANENSNSKGNEHGKIATQTVQRSQDAVRHQKDGLHHKFHGRPPASPADEAQQDSVDMQQNDGQQPEIPKVGSRDAPGG